MKRRLTAAVALFALLMLATTTGASADGRSVDISPAHDLVDGQVVNLSWNGFNPGESVYLYVCKHGTSDASECDTPGGDPDLIISDDNGGGNIRFQLPMATYQHFHCNNTAACDVVVMQNQDDLSSSVRAPFDFAPPPEACPAATAPPVAGEGASAGAYSFYKWEAAVCKLSSHLNVTYTNDNSFDGMQHWVESNPNANFAVSGIPLPGDEAKQLAKSHRTFAYAPFSLTALSIVFNIVDQEGRQINHLVVTPKILAEIANGSLSTLDCPSDVTDSDCTNFYGGDPDIRKLNPGVDFPAGPIQFYIRSDHSASNLAFTSWLSENAPTQWPYGVSSVWPPPAPHACLACPGGISGESNVLQTAGFPPFYTPGNAYIAVVDSSYAAVGDLPAASLQNPGQPNPVAPTTASLDAAVNDGTSQPDGTLVPKWDTSDANAYPLPILTYALVPTSKGWPNFTGENGKTLAAFLRYTAGDGQKALVDGSYPLTDALAKQTSQAAGKIPTSGSGSSGDGGNDGNGGTLPSTSGGGTTDNFGAGTGGSGTVPTADSAPSPTPVSHGGGGPTTPAASKPSTGSPLAFTIAGATLSSSTASALIPALLALALLAIVIGPSLLLLSRDEDVVIMGKTLPKVSLPRPSLSKPAPTWSGTDKPGGPPDAGAGGGTAGE